MQNEHTDIENYKVKKGPIKLEKIQVYYGANYYSGGPIVLFRINLGAYDEVFTDQIEGFYEKLSSLLPSLYEHYCSVGKIGGFFLRVREGTLPGHVMEHVAIELQTLAGMDVGYGKTRSTLSQGVYNVIFRYFDEEAGIYAGKAALNLVNSILKKEEFDVFQIIKNLIYIREKNLLGPSTQAIVDEAEKRGIPWLRLDEFNLVQLGTGKYNKRVQATLTSDTSYIATEMASDKFQTTLMLKEAGVPVPETIKTNNQNEIIDFRKRSGKAVVVKPVKGALGEYSWVGVNTLEDITEAYNLAREAGEFILAQEFIPGKSYRLLVIDYKFVAAAELELPAITGNGKSTIAGLIEELNSQPGRKWGDKDKLSKVEIDNITKRILLSKNYTLNTVLPEGEKLILKKSGNPKAGGFSRDVTAKVNYMNKFLAERAARTIGLNVAGVDIITKNIGTSILDNGGIILEINAAPDFRMHINPAEGKPRNVAVNLLNMLFPKNSAFKVPVFSVTGTAGKTIAVNLLNYCLEQSGYKTGMTNSDGLFITGKCLLKGDASYPEHVALVLKDKTIDCAVLETSREGIIRKGLGYQFADYGIVLNIFNDHIGSDDIKYIEDLAYAKSVVAEQVYDDGFTILNADNKMVFEMKERIYSQLALFSKNSENKHVCSHTRRGGLAVYIENEKIIIHHKNIKSALLSLQEIPLTFKNKAEFLYDEILAVVTALYAHGIKPVKIKTFLKNFKPDRKRLHGRMNLIEKNNFTALIDNVHNEAGFLGLKDFLGNFKKTKTGVLDAAGDRSDEDIKNLGKIAAETYQYLYLYEGYENRGRKNGEIVNLLRQGALQNDMPSDKIFVFDSLKNALSAAIKSIGHKQMLILLTSRPDYAFGIIDKVL